MAYTGHTVDELLRLLVEQTKEYAIILQDVDGIITWWNQGAEEIFGVPRAEAVGKHASMLFAPEDIERGIPENEIATARSDVAAEDDRWLARPNGSRFWATGALIPVHGSQGELLGLGKILRNRTDIREQLETARNQAESFEVSNRRKDLFLSTLSHELRNPLAPLSSAVQLIRLSAPATPEMEYCLKIMTDRSRACGDWWTTCWTYRALARGRWSSRRKRLHCTTCSSASWKA